MRCDDLRMPRDQATDDLDRYIVERARRSPKLPMMVAARVRRLEMQRRLAKRRLALGMTLNEAAVLMRTSNSSIARLESGEHDVRVATLQRYAGRLGCSVAMTLNEAL